MKRQHLPVNLRNSLLKNHSESRRQGTPFIQKELSIGQSSEVDKALNEQ